MGWKKRGQNSLFHTTEQGHYPRYCKAKRVEVGQHIKEDVPFGQLRQLFKYRRGIMNQIRVAQRHSFWPASCARRSKNYS